jgi:hypothetical protein
VGHTSATVVRRGAGLRQTVGWLLGSSAMTFRSAICVDGAPALGLQQWCCADVGSPAVWVAPVLGLASVGSRQCWVSGAF